jgi:hypothetical protein
MSSISFDEYAMNTWVEMCKKEKKMREEGTSSEDELRIIHVCVMAGMVNLLPNLSTEEKDSLLQFLLQKDTILPESGDPEVQ